MKAFMNVVSEFLPYSAWALSIYNLYVGDHLMSIQLMLVAIFLKK